MRKHFLPLTSLLVLLACSPSNVQRIPIELNLYGLDFSVYSKEGFFVSPEMYQGSYDPIGILTLEYYPEAKYIKQIISVEEQDSLYGFNTGYSISEFRWETQSKKIQNVLDSVVGVAKSMGADALVNFEYLPTSKTHDDIPNPVRVSGFILTGFAIDRKEFSTIKSEKSE